METIKKLREKTGAGIVDCKKALEEAGGDLEKAAELLRKKGIAKAAKREDREATEGVVKVGTDDSNTKGYILTLNSETDFVALNEQFQNLAAQIFDLARKQDIKDIDALLEAKMEDGKSVKEAVDMLSGVIGEKLVLSQYNQVSAETVAAYSHMGGRIGVLVGLNQAGKAELATDIAMQIAAANPRYMKRDEVPQEELDKEKEVYREQLLKEGKPAEMIDKILEGKLNKYYEEVCLVDQEYIKDDKKKVKDILDGVEITRFVRQSL